VAGEKETTGLENQREAAEAADAMSADNSERTRRLMWRGKLAGSGTICRQTLFGGKRICHYASGLKGGTLER